MKKIKIVALMLIFALSLQCIAFANVQPRGVYLQAGGCTIAPSSGSVIVTGHTQAFEAVDKITVEVSVLKEVAMGVWTEVWSQTLSDYDENYVCISNARVAVDKGYRYMVEATHTVKHGSLTETNYSETNPVIVSY